MSAAGLLAQRYELGELIGYGGISEVYRARDTRLGRDVAVKTLRTDLRDDATAQSQFRREAQHAAVLDHPAIVSIYDVGTAGTVPYLVMEYVSGHTLRRIRTIGGPVEQRRALEIITEVCAALDFAHQHGVVHGDVKPANVMIEGSGAVKVMDFGITHGTAREPSELTRRNGADGGDYLSPEQARGEPADARSDVYAAGGLLFEMLVGSPPFEAYQQVAVGLERRRREPRPPSAVDPAIDPQLDGIVLTALATNPEHRYQSAAAMRTTVKRRLAPTAAKPAGAASTAPATPSANEPLDDVTTDGERPVRRRPLKVGLLALLGLAVVGGAIWLASALLGTGGPEPVAVPTLRGQPASVATSTLLHLTLNPKRHQVFCQTGADGARAPCRADQVGTVLRTDPAPGQTLDPDGDVAVYVAAPAQRATVPSDLRGKTVAAVTRRLHRLGLQVSPERTTAEVTDPALIGEVVRSDPAGGTHVDKGSRVTLSVGKRPAMVRLPDETGRPAQQARSDLEDRGFQVETTPTDSSGPKGTVIGQQPGGATARHGSPVTLTVSNGEGSHGDVTGGRGQNGRGSYVCTQDKLYFAACNPDTLGQVVQYPPYSG